ncbi:MAG: hypothetical protein WD716_13020 [Fimbriimonadaceae bacterium]
MTTLLLAAILHAPCGSDQDGKNKLPKLEDIRVAGAGLGMNAAHLVSVLGAPFRKDEIVNGSLVPTESIAGKKAARAVWKTQVITEGSEPDDIYLMVEFELNSATEIQSVAIGSEFPATWKKTSNIPVTGERLPTDGDFALFRLQTLNARGTEDILYPARYFLNGRVKYDVFTYERDGEVVTVNDVTIAQRDQFESDHARYKRLAEEYAKRMAEADTKLEAKDPAYNVVFEQKRVGTTRNGLDQVLSAKATGILRNNRKSPTRVKVRLTLYLDGDFLLARDKEIGELRIGASTPFELVVDIGGGTKGEITYDLEVLPSDE